MLQILSTEDGAFLNQVTFGFKLASQINHYLEEYFGSYQDQSRLLCIVRFQIVKQKSKINIEYIFSLFPSLSGVFTSIQTFKLYGCLLNFCSVIFLSNILQRHIEFILLGNKRKQMVFKLT